jgi:hypothetical protein
LKSQLLKNGFSQSDIDEAVAASQQPQMPEAPPIPKEVQSVQADDGLEKVKGTFNVSSGNTFYRIYITDRRAIVVQTRNTFWLFFMLGWIGSMISLALMNKKVEQLDSLTPESILKSNNHNKGFDIGSVSSIELKKPGFMSFGKVTIVADKKTAYNFADKQAYLAAEEVLKANLSEKLKYV